MTALSGPSPRSPLRRRARCARRPAARDRRERRGPHRPSGCPGTSLSARRFLRARCARAVCGRGLRLPVVPTGATGCPQRTGEERRRGRERVHRRTAGAARSGVRQMRARGVLAGVHGGFARGAETRAAACWRHRPERGAAHGPDARARSEEQAPRSSSCTAVRTWWWTRGRRWRRPGCWPRWDSRSRRTSYRGLATGSTTGDWNSPRGSSSACSAGQPRSERDGPVPAEPGAAVGEGERGAREASWAGPSSWRETGGGLRRPSDGGFRRSRARPSRRTRVGPERP